MTEWVRSREHDGVTVRETTGAGVCVAELRFSPRYAHATFDPELGYLAVVIEGDLRKTFPARTLGLTKGVAVSIPGAASHSATFGEGGARIVVVEPSERDRPCATLLSRVVARREPGLTALAARIAVELEARDEVAPLAVEGLALELVAAAARSVPDRLPAVRPRWLDGVVERLHAEPVAELSLRELAASANVDPAHLGRVFRRRHGVSVGTYLRRLRLDRAAAQLAESDAPVASIAAEQGFADQSHFTRAFKLHTGVTPARYRRLAGPS